MNLCIINYSKRPAHQKHISALKAFLLKMNVDVVSFYKAKNIYYQTTNPKNILSMFISKILFKNIIFYYHEPCFFSEKIKKKNTYFYSFAVKLVQSFEYFFSDYIIVSNTFVRRKVTKIHSSKKKIIVIPLIIKEEQNDKSLRDIDILFLGRAVPDQRNLDIFIQLSKKLTNLKFAILTADNIKKSEFIEIISSGKRFSESLRIETLNRTKVVWTPYSSHYNQSGIVPDALAHGCCLILSNYETDKKLLKKDFVLCLSMKQKNLDIKIKNFFDNNLETLSILAYNEFLKKYTVDSYKPLLDILK